MRSGSLVPTEPERGRNERLWAKGRADPPITPVGEITNAATIEDGRRSALVGVPVREDYVKAQQDRRDAAAVRASPAEETTMARTVSTESDKAERREALREYLNKHGPTSRKDLLSALGYPDGEKGYYQLRTDYEAIGATSETRQGPVSLPTAGAPAVEKPAPVKRKGKPVEAEPVRPSLAAAALAAIRQANDEGAPLYLDHEFVAALAARLAEAGL